jgi:hypothetical protein
MRRSSTLILAAFCLHCSSEVDPFAPPEVEIECEVDDKELPSSTVALSRLEASNDATSLLVWGTVNATRQLAIRSLTVQGIAAVKDGFNYSTWNATLPESAFREKIVGTEVTLVARGNDPCNPFEAELHGELPESLREP